MTWCDKQLSSMRCLTLAVRSISINNIGKYRPGWSSRLMAFKKLHEMVFIFQLFQRYRECTNSAGRHVVFMVKSLQLIVLPQKQVINAVNLLYLKLYLIYSILLGSSNQL